jgi:hypothetical protein
MKCPMVPEACEQVIGLDHAEYYTSPKCRAAAFQSGSLDKKVAGR